MSIKRISQSKFSLAMLAASAAALSGAVAGAADLTAPRVDAAVGAIVAGTTQIQVYIVQGSSAEAVAARVRTVGGKVVSELPLIRGVGAELTASQAESLRAAGDLRLQADRHVGIFGGVVSHVFRGDFVHPLLLLAGADQLINGDREIEGASLHSSSGNEPLPPWMELLRLLTHGPNSRRFNYKIWGREDRSWPTSPFASRSRGNFTRHWNGESLMDMPFNVVMKDNGSIRTFGECLNKMQKPGRGASLSEVPEVLTYAGKIRIALRVRTRQKQKLLRDL